MAKTPKGPFEYKGVIVSNGDIGYEGNTLPVNYTGNNHGGLVEVEGAYYIFWHRHTHGTAFSRQGCADRVVICEDGTIPQIEITSCGLNDGALPTSGQYSAYIACHLTEGDREKVGQVIMAGPGEAIPELPEEMPYITEEVQEDDVVCDEATLTKEENLYPYICNMRKGALAGFKYFAFSGNETKIGLTLRGEGTMEVLLDTAGEKVVGNCEKSGENWEQVWITLPKIEGKQALYFRVAEGKVDFAEFEIR